MMDMFRIPAKKELRGYQIRAINDLKASILAGNRRIVLTLPTGGGKTLVAANIVNGALAKGGKAVFTAPMITLIDQTIEAFEREGIFDIGAIQSNHRRTDPNAKVQVCSVQTLERRDTLPSASVVLVDECHVYSKSVVEWMRAEPNLIFIGLSATPGRAGMADEWQDLVVGTTTRELMDLGFLSQFTVYAASIPDLSGVKIVAGDYQAKGAAEVMQGGELVGDILQNYILNGEDRPTLGFAVNVAHAKRMAEEFTDAGIPSAYVEARTDSLERRAIQDQFRRGKIKVVWSVRTMTTGVDLPVSGIIDAAPTRSEMLHQQKIGRGLRVNPGTEDLKIWDHAGNTLRLGFVDELDWSSLPGGKRKEAGERNRPLPKDCAECGCIMGPKVKVCPNCGAERKVPSGFVETADGDLVPLNKEVAGRPVYTMAEKQRWYSSLLGICEERGYKKGLAYHKFYEKFGVYPARSLDRVPMKPAPEVRAWYRSRQIAYAKAQEKARNAASHESGGVSP